MDAAVGSRGLVRIIVVDATGFVHGWISICWIWVVECFSRGVNWEIGDSGRERKEKGIMRWKERNEK